MRTFDWEINCLPFDTAYYPRKHGSSEWRQFVARMSGPFGQMAL